MGLASQRSTGKFLKFLTLQFPLAVKVLHLSIYHSKTYYLVLIIVFNLFVVLKPQYLRSWNTRNFQIKNNIISFLGYGIFERLFDFWWNSNRQSGSCLSLTTFVHCLCTVNKTTNYSTHFLNQNISYLHSLTCITALEN